MSSRVVPVLALAVALSACKPAVPARVKEQPLAVDSTCKDSFLLHIDPDTCEWKRIDAATDDVEVLLEDSKYCSSYEVAVHPTEPRLFAYLIPEDDRSPDALREISVAEGVVRTIKVPRDIYIEYSGYDAQGRLTVVVSDELPEPSRVMQLVDEMMNRESCALYRARARALAFDGDKWAVTETDVGEECGDPAPTDVLSQRMLSKWTMAGTTTLIGLAKVEERTVLEGLAAAMDDADDPPVWKEARTPHGRILRGADTYGDAFWIAFTDSSGRVAGKPAYDDNNKLRVRGPYLLTTAEEEENGRLYDIRTGALLWEAESYSATVFWPCPTPP